MSLCLVLLYRVPTVSFGYLKKNFSAFVSDIGFVASWVLCDRHVIICFNHRETALIIVYFKLICTSLRICFGIIAFRQHMHITCPQSLGNFFLLDPLPFADHNNLVYKVIQFQTKIIKYWICSQIFPCFSCRRICHQSSLIIVILLLYS